ncbi:MAG: hypothetical protein AMXMBFR4_17130 [Candidatus Hydrogenedentota bacterium]
MAATEDVKNGEGPLAVRKAAARRFAGWSLVTLLLILALICLAFTCAASLLLLVFFVLSEEGGNAWFLTKLIVKCGGSGLLASALAITVCKRSQARPSLELRGSQVSVTTPWLHRLALAGAILLFLGLCFPNLGRYPKLEPDESHHLIVARNLAESGAYASGHVDTGFRWFDDYDSVGPTVIVPVAAAFKIAGIGLPQGRFVMAGWFLLLAVLVWLFMRGVFGKFESVVAAAWLMTATGSVYLSRTLYGEAPALALFVAALLCWRRAIASDRSAIWGTAAGVLFGLSVVSKLFMILAVWPLVGALIYDRVSFRRIRTVTLIAPAAGAILPVGAWLLVTSAYGPSADGATAGLVSMYQHNLMFGLRSAKDGLGWLFQEPLKVSFYLVGVIACVPAIACMRYDPPAVALLLFGAFNLYWWIFFTPGTTPRYVWYSLAIGAVFTGRFLCLMLKVSLLRRLTDFDRRPRIIAVPAALCILGSGFLTALNVGKSVWLDDDMRDDRALAAWVRELPREARIITTDFTVERAMRFLTGRRIDRVQPSSDLGDASAMIFDTVLREDLVDKLSPFETLGRYGAKRIKTGTGE